MPNPNQSSGQQATATDGGLNAAAGVVADGVQLPLKSRGLLWSVIAIVLILMVGGAAVFLSRPQDAPEIDAEADSDAEQTAEPQQPAPHPEPGPTQLPAAKKTPPGDRAASVATPAESPVEPSKPSKPSKPRKPRKPNRTKREQQSAAPKAETPQKPGGSSIDLGY
jgi:cytoskeletal protein RodZ